MIVNIHGLISSASAANGFRFAANARL